MQLNMSYLGGRGLGGPLHAVCIAVTSLCQAAASSGVADGQVVGAAVHVVVAAGGLWQGAAGPAEAVAQQLAHAAAGAACSAHQSKCTQLRHWQQHVCPKACHVVKAMHCVCGHCSRWPLARVSSPAEAAAQQLVHAAASAACRTVRQMDHGKRCAPTVHVGMLPLTLGQQA